MICRLRKDVDSKHTKKTRAASFRWHACDVIFGATNGRQRQFQSSRISTRQPRLLATSCLRERAQDHRMQSLAHLQRSGNLPQRHARAPTRALRRPCATVQGLCERGRRPADERHGPSPDSQSAVRGCHRTAPRERHECIDQLETPGTLTGSLSPSRSAAG
jgi:hypothetical protein